MENAKLLGFLDPALKQIDNGNFFRKPFYWLYLIIGVLNPLGAIYFLIKTIDMGFFKMVGGGTIVLFIIFWLFLLAITGLAFLLWWNRKDKVKEIADNEDQFVAIPVLTHFIQTMGEWLGLLVATLGIVGTLMVLIVPEMGYVVPAEYGAMGLILYPIAGFLIVVVARFVAEAWRALAAIANNTRCMADK